MDKDKLNGLLGALGIWVTAGIAAPLVKLITLKQELSVEQVMTFRGFITALIAFILCKGKIMGVGKYTYLLAIALPLATLGIFKGVENWDVGPTFIIIAMTPLVNLAIGPFMKRKIVPGAILGFILMFCGVVTALWGKDFQWSGFGWSVFGAVMCGFTIECIKLAMAASENPMKMCFWAHNGMGLLGLILSVGSVWTPVIQPKIGLYVLANAAIGGFLYWISNMKLFGSKIDTSVASILAQGETPAIIIGAYYILSEELTLNKCIGVTITFLGAGFLASRAAKADGSGKVASL